MYKSPKIGFVMVMGTMINIEEDTERCNREAADGLYIDDTIILKSYYDNKKHFKRILYHEMFHALCEVLGVQLDIHTEETLANTMSYMFSDHEEYE